MPESLRLLLTRMILTIVEITVELLILCFYSWNDSPNVVVRDSCTFLRELTVGNHTNTSKTYVDTVIASGIKLKASFCSSMCC